MKLLLVLAVLPCISLAQLDIGVPRLHEPEYSDDGQITFFPRIVGGMAATAGEIPGIVSLQNTQGQHFCGGTWIDSTHVLTAAHCLTDDRGRVYSPTLFQVMGDDLSVTSTNRNSSRQVLRLTHIFVHPQYNLDAIRNDIALIRLERSFNATTRFHAIGRAAATPAAGTSCVVAGWGVLNENGASASPALMRLSVPVVAMATCNSTSSYQGIIPLGTLCAGNMNGGQDACQGDSGGPLICNGALAGVVSFGYGCARPRFPGVYTDVAQFQTWINQMMVWQGTQNQVPTPTTTKPGSASAITVSLALMAASMIATMF